MSANGIPRGRTPHQYPEYAVLWSEDGKNSNGAAYSFYANNAHRHGYACTGIALNGIREWAFSLKSGLYIFEQLYVGYNGLPIVTWSIDGLVVAVVDYYQAGGLVMNLVKQQTVTVPTDGNHTLRAQITGKNASGTDYDFLLTRAVFKKP